MAVFHVSVMSSLSCVVLDESKAASAADFGVAGWRRGDGAIAQWIACYSAGEVEDLTTSAATLSAGETRDRMW